MLHAEDAGERGDHLRAFVAEKMFHDLRDFSRLLVCLGRVHSPELYAERKNVLEKVSSGTGVSPVRTRALSNFAKPALENTFWNAQARRPCHY